MASAVEICNLALAHLGDTATVSSIDPPEGSPQAEHCARFYPIARDSLLEMHTWGFCTKRMTLALRTDVTISEWKYIYESPASALNIIAILAQDAPNDYSQDFPMAYTQQGIVNTGQGLYTPQPYAVESLEDGTQVIYTNQENATARFTEKVVDTTQFSPLFTDTLARLLASYLAGPVIKGDVGRAEAKGQYGIFLTLLARATTSDANQRRTVIKQSTPWMAGR